MSAQAPARPVEAAVARLLGVAERETAEVADAAQEVGYWRGFEAGWEACERAHWSEETAA